MTILAIFKSKSSKSKASKLSISAPVAVVAIPPTNKAVASSSSSSTEEAPQPPQAVADNSALTAPVQVIKGNQKFLGSVTNNNSTTTNSNNDNTGNINSTITGDSITIDKGIDEILQRPANFLWTPENVSTPTRIRNSVTIERNGVVETIPLDLPSGGLGIETNVLTSNPDLATMIEQSMRAHGTAEPIIRHTINGLQAALQMKALQQHQQQVAVTA